MCRLGGILRRRWEGIRLEDESTLTRRVGHPPQRDLSQRRVGIATADVAVHAFEPHLFDVLAGPRVAGPRDRPERAELLVDGHGLERRVCVADEACRAGRGERAKPEPVALIARLVVVDEEA